MSFDQTVHFPSGNHRLAANLYVPGNKAPAPVVVVSHGAGGWKEDLEPLCEILSGAGYAALSVDMSGHGESEGPRWYLDMSQWCRDLSAAIDYAESRADLDTSRLAIWGFSSGGTAMYEAALKDSRIKILMGLGATISSRGLPWGARWVLGTLHAAGKIKKN
jgi:dienelactone hydrolase